MPIPKTFHQTHKTRNIPQQCLGYRDRVRAVHPDWDYRFYDDEACRAVVREHMPGLLPIYDGYSHKIQRTDMFRMVAVHAYGGFYLDLDMLLIQSLQPLLVHRAVFAEESILSEEKAKELGHHDRLRIANYMFAAEPGHPFISSILEEMADRSEREIRREHDILESTGPGLVTTLYHERMDNNHDVTVAFNEQQSVCRRCGRVSCQFGQYAAHHHMGTWRWEGLVNSTSQSETRAR
jgi:mannosyltransferase OCH1-like enzyme